MRRPLHAKLWRFDADATAFNFRVNALDLRLRAESILVAASGLRPWEWSDDDLHEALNIVAQAYADSERADLLEATALNIRARSLAKEHPHAPGSRTA